MLRSGRYGVAGLLALLVALPVQAADKKAQSASEQDYSALAQAGEIVGKIKSVNASDKTFTLEIDLAALKNGRQAEEHLARLQQDLLRTTNPIQRLRKQQQLAAEVQRLQVQQLNPNKSPSTTQHRDFDLQSTEDAQVRLQDPPVQYDEKGNRKKYTPKELRELKGDPKLPGYAADWSDLKVGQTVKVTVTRPKNKDKDKKDDAHPQAKRILVTRDAPAGKK
jgi:hypothetical protein